MTDPPSTALVLAPSHPLGLAAPTSPGARLVQAFLRGRSATTLRAYRNDLVDFAGFLGLHGDGAIDAAAATVLQRGHGGANELALAYRDHLLAATLAPATVNRRLAALRSLVQVANLLDLVTWRIDVENVKSKKYRDTRGPGEDGMAKLYAKLAERTDLKGIRDHAIVHLLFDLGLRRGEVASLDRGHLDLSGRALSILGKGRRERESLRLPAPTQAALAAWTAELSPDYPDTQPLFFSLDPTSYGHRLTGAALYKIIRTLGEAVDIRARPHGLRHAAITAALERTNGNIRKAASFARHSDPRTTAMYDDNRANLGGEVADLVAGSVPARATVP